MGHEEPKQLEKLNAQWLTPQECSVANSTSSSCFATKMVSILYMNTHTHKFAVVVNAPKLIMYFI